MMQNKLKKGSELEQKMGRGGSQGWREERSQWFSLLFLAPATLTGQHSLLVVGPEAL